MVRQTPNGRLSVWRVVLKLQHHVTPSPVLNVRNNQLCRITRIFPNMHLALNNNRRSPRRQIHILLWDLIIPTLDWTGSASERRVLFIAGGLRLC